MCEISSSITVFFEEPFWVGIYERKFGKKYEVCKITFGAEPKDYDVYSFLLKNYAKLKFSRPVKASQNSEKAINPKRMQRLIKKQLQSSGAGTKAQQALQLSCEREKSERKEISREQKEAEAERKYELRIEKRKEKHRGH